jgi:branched-chain amino acid transport system ATP-binding protein
MLVVKQLEVSYDHVPAIIGLSLEVNQGELVAMVGANGAGKSTFVKAVAGVLAVDRGEIVFEGESIVGLASHKVVRKGIALVPEGRRLFARLSIYENLLVGATTQRDPQVREEMLAEIFTLFPILKERREQKAGTLSGGEQQMLTIARALMSRPRLLMLDEPSLGVMPILVENILRTLQQLNQERGMTMLLIEQNVREALEIANRGYVLQSGKVVAQGPANELLASDMVRLAYLGM